MIPINRTYAPLQAFVEELTRCGMRHAVTSPGSRNAPLALTLAAQDELTTVSVLDERSAGFVALGMAKACGLPVAVTCTSGTAAANLHPAVVEAYEARVPLIVLTADRPPELRDVGAGQAIDQLDLYGSAARWFVEVGNHDPGPDSNVHHRALACRAWWSALGDRPGPVHLNFPLREPLAPVSEELHEADWQGRADGRPWVEVCRPAGTPRTEDVEELAARMAGAPRGVIVCGPVGEAALPADQTGAGRKHAASAETEAERRAVAGADSRDARVAGASPERASATLAAVANGLASTLGWPILAEPTSGLRCGPHDRSHVVAHYDLLLRHGRFAAEHTPELVLRIGDMPTSKPLRAWLTRASQVVVDPHRAWHEPTRAAELVLQSQPAATLAALERALGKRAVQRDEGWLRAWREADALVPGVLEQETDPCEPKAVAAIEPALAEGTIVWASSSMPIRHVESFFPQSPRRLRFLANRGANGIDGVISSAAGAALASGAPTVVLIGELALLHDLGGLLAARRAGARLAILCLNNGGGGIFDLLPVAASAPADLYERHIATPTDVSLETVAELTGLRHARASTAEEVGERLAEGTLLEVRSERPLQQAALVERVLARLEHVREPAD